MSQSLTDRLKKAVEFDEARAILELPLGLSAVDPNDVGNQLLRQVKRENTRLQPILTALIECVGALEFYNDHHQFSDGTQMTAGQFRDMDDYGAVAREALSRLEKELG